MFAILHALGMFVVDLFKARSRLEAEKLFFRRQLIRAGFKIFWRWKSRNRAGRPRIDRGLRDLIQRMNRENPRWSVSRIHGELLMLGFEVAQSTVSKYIARPSKRRRKAGRLSYQQIPAPRRDILTAQIRGLNRLWSTRDIIAATKRLEHAGPIRVSAKSKIGVRSIS
jgi:hypothetical protein